MTSSENPAFREEHLTLAEFARRAGAHPNTIRKLIHEGNIEYLIEDRVSGERLSPESPKPKKFRYLLPNSAVQHVVSLLNPPVKRSSRVGMEGNNLPASTTSQEAEGEVTRLRRELARAEAENALLKQHNAFLENLTEKLLPMLPAASTNEVRPPQVSWWRRLFGKRGEAS